MIVVDTSIWIEFFRCNPQIFPRLKELLEKQNVLALECIFAELLQGAKDEKEIDIIYSYWDNLPKINLDNLWLEAGEYSCKNKLISKGIGLIDAVIILSARKNKAKIWTLDKKLKNELEVSEQY